MSVADGRPTAVVSRTRTIACERERIWATLADFGGISRWSPKVDHSSLLRVTADGDQVGAPEPTDTSEANEPTASAGTIGLTRRLQVGRMVLLERVLTWDEPSRLSYDIGGLPRVVRSAVNEWRLEPVGASVTLVTLTSSIDCGARPVQRLVARIVGWRMAKESDAMLAGIDRLLGGEAAHV